MAAMFGVPVAECDHLRSHPTNVQMLVPRTFHADSVVVFCDTADRPVFAVVFEVQRGYDPGKRHTWKLYVAHLEAELGVEVALLVYCPSRSVADRYRALVKEEVRSSLSLRPLIFTPDMVPPVVDVEAARADPAMAVFSAICHSDDADVDRAFPALAEALAAAGPEKGILYYDVVLAGLPEAARMRWEAFMSTAAGYEFQSDFAKRYVNEGKAEGKAEGEARAIMTVLEGRGVPVPDDVREQILSCTDLAQLDTWLRRAITATSADEVVRT